MARRWRNARGIPSSGMRPLRLSPLASALQSLADLQSWGGGAQVPRRLALPLRLRGPVERRFPPADAPGPPSPRRMGIPQPPLVDGERAGDGSIPLPPSPALHPLFDMRMW